MNKCVKIERVATCFSGEVKPCGWCEYYSPYFHHPYDVHMNEWVHMCNNNENIALLIPLVGEKNNAPQGEWLASDLVDLADRFTCEFNQDENESCRNKLLNEIELVFKNGGTKWMTITDKDDKFALYKLTALEKIPNLQPFNSKWCYYDGDKEPPKIAYDIINNLIKQVNGESMNMIEFPFTASAVATSIFSVKAETIDKALSYANEKADSLKWSDLGEIGYRDVVLS